MPSQNYENDIHPELAESSMVYREIMRTSENFMSMGIDPALAVAIVASVPLALRILKMMNEFVTASLEDWKEGRRLKRKREEYELDREFNKK